MYKRQQLDSKNDENKQLKNSLDEMNKKYNSEIVIYKAEIIGLKALNGEIKPSEDFTSEEEFTNLEESYLAFTEFFENQWKMTKKEIIKKIKKDLGVPVVSDIHETIQVEKAAEVLDILQIPAFLCRQTDLVYEAAKTGRVVNIKKGQFLAPWDMKNVLKKAEEAGNHNIMLTERGASFGYNALVTDMRSLAIMRELGYPVVMDATHSVQIPGGQGTTSGGQSQYVPHMARAAAAVGIDALFLEVHDNPEEALSDGPNMVRLDKLEKLLTDVLAIDKIVRG